MAKSRTDGGALLKALKSPPSFLPVRSSKYVTAAGVGVRSSAAGGRAPLRWVSCTLWYQGISSVYPKRNPIDGRNFVDSKKHHNTLFPRFVCPLLSVTRGRGIVSHKGAGWDGWADHVIAGETLGFGLEVGRWVLSHLVHIKQKKNNNNKMGHKQQAYPGNAHWVNTRLLS